MCFFFYFTISTDINTRSCSSHQPICGRGGPSYFVQCNARSLNSRCYLRLADVLFVFIFHFENIKITREEKKNFLIVLNIFFHSDLRFQRNTACQLLKILRISCRCVYFFFVQLCNAMFRFIIIVVFQSLFLSIFRGLFSLRVIFLHNCVIIWIYSRRWENSLDFF